MDFMDFLMFLVCRIFSNSDTLSSPELTCSSCGCVRDSWKQIPLIVLKGCFLDVVGKVWKPPWNWIILLPSQLSTEIIRRIQFFGGLWQYILENCLHLFHDYCTWFALFLPPKIRHTPTQTRQRTSLMRVMASGDPKQFLVPWVRWAGFLVGWCVGLKIIVIPKIWYLFCVFLDMIFHLPKLKFKTSSTVWGPRPLVVFFGDLSEVFFPWQFRVGYWTSIPQAVGSMI